jgi:uncharacterized membrane protein YeaQ/YmgE (transglycosylase-associated protein family)
MVNLIYFLLIGLAAGWLASQLMKGKSLGLAGNLAVGVIGSILGGFLIAPGTRLGSLIAATAGAMLLLFLLQKLSK